MHTKSLFARKLRSWRSSHGTHGRMTQETLAEQLDVSVDAIGKYERSVSYIRSDLEHRLAERLGWSRDTILACREDWAIRQSGPRQSPYRLLDETVVNDTFGGSWQDAILAMIKMVEAALGDLPRELAADDATYLPTYDSYRDHWAAVMHGDQIVAKWAVSFLLPEDETLFRQGTLIESDLTLERLRQPILPGTYFAYCPALVISPGHEASVTHLLSAFVAFLERMAERGIFVHGIGAVTCSPSGAQLGRDLGMIRLCDYALGPEYGVWELPGHAIAKSIFGRRSAFLRRSYCAAFGD